jgi:hypothetical protein
MKYYARYAAWTVLSITYVTGCSSWHGADSSGIKTQNLYPPDCTKSCVAGCGQSDGCGGLCQCPQDQACSSSGVCVPATSCVESCPANWTCGNVCGTDCGANSGACPADQVCVQGSCMAPRDVSCADCPLQLKVVDHTQSDTGVLTGVTLSLVYAPAEGAAHPRIADFRIQADRAVTLTQAELGAPLASMGKELFVDPTSHDNWQELSPGVFQLLVISRTDAQRFGAGEFLRLHFAIDAHVGAASFHLVKRDEVFAPADANNVVQGTKYDAPVVVH